jgi:His-Xaa-Ser system protein HxsD
MSIVDNNFNIEEENGVYKLFLNPKFYSLDVIYSVCYVFLDKAYISLDGDLDDKIIVIIKPKDGCDGEKIALDFNNDLLTHADYKRNFENNKNIRDMILQRAIITNDPSSLSVEDNSGIEDIFDEDEDIESLEDIVIPWEEENEENN